MSIQAVVFDIGGVLEITPSLGVIERWEQKLGLPPGAMAEQLGSVWEGGSIGTISEADVYQSTGRLPGIDETLVNAFMDDIWVEYLGELNSALIAYIQSLRPQYKIGILNNSFVGAREREQEHYHFDEITDLIIYSHEVGLSKPDPRIYALTCERLNVKPAEMIFVDDVEKNITAAQEFGIQAILFKDNTQAIADINACLLAYADNANDLNVKEQTL